MIDVSSVKELARRWYPRVYFASPAKIGGRDRGLIDEAIGLAETLKDAAARSGIARTIVLSSIKAISGRSGAVAHRQLALSQPCWRRLARLLARRQRQ